MSEISKLRSTNQGLIMSLVIAAFLLGFLTNKVADKSTTISDDVKQAPQAAAPTAAKKPKTVSAADHIKGNKNAKVTLIEYSDYECPFCKNFQGTINELMEFYGDKVRLVYRHYPLPFHANAQKESEASECVAQLGGNEAFWKFSDTIYERTTTNGTGFALDALGPLAAEVGVNQQEFQSCLDSGKYEKLVKDSISEASGAGVTGTPSTFINNQIIVGAFPVDSFKTAIDCTLDNKKFTTDSNTGAVTCPK